MVWVGLGMTLCGSVMFGRVKWGGDKMPSPYNPPTHVDVAGVRGGVLEVWSVDLAMASVGKILEYTPKKGGGQFVGREGTKRTVCSE